MLVAGIAPRRDRFVGPVVTTIGGGGDGQQKNHPTETRSGPIGLLMGRPKTTVIAIHSIRDVPWTYPMSCQIHAHT